MNNTKTAERIRNNYLQPENNQKMDELIALDKKAKRLAQIFAYVFGTVGALVLGTGMSLAMGVIGASMPLGIAVGVVGIAMVSVNPLIHKKLLQKGKTKYGEQILALSNNLLSE